MSNFVLKIANFLFFDRKIFEKRQDLAELAMSVFFVSIIFSLIIGGTHLLIWIFK